MTDVDALLQTLSLATGVAWACGLNLYAAVVALGVAGATGYIDLPPGLAVVQDPMVIIFAGGMYCVEFFAGKIPSVDTFWETVHTFIRIPAGALLAAGAVGDVAPALSVAAALLGGGITAATHVAKVGGRAVINSPPGSIGKVAVTIAEDVAVFGGLWLALKQPLSFAIAFGLFLLLLVWNFPRLWSGTRILYRRLGRWLGMLPLADAATIPKTESPSVNRG